MHKFWIGLGVVGVFIVIAILALPNLIDVNRYRSQIEAQLEQRLERDVTLGQITLSLYPLAFRVDNATVAEDPAFSSKRPFAEASTFLVSPKLLPLLRQDIQLARLELRDPKLELIRNEKGVWNFTSLTRNSEGQPKSFSLRSLKIFNGE